LSSLATRITLLATAVRDKFNAINSRLDPWTRTVLTSDFNNALGTAVTITDGTRTFSYTPPANSNFTIEAELLVWTTSATNLPLIGVGVTGGNAQGMFGVDIQGPGATVNAAPQCANGAVNNQNPATSFFQAAGGVLAASVPYVVKVLVKGRSGNTPQPILIQMKCETAAASTCYVKAGSEMRTRAGY
jgi:hypothetical protein